MASLRTIPVIFGILFYVLASTATATDAPDYVVQGRVYCDTCRAGFETNVTEYIKGKEILFWVRSLVRSPALAHLIS